MIELSIPKPCHESWEQMTLGEAGRYCVSCSKHVIDFSEMSNAELADYFLKNQDKRICGRYRNNQLNVPLLTISDEIFFKEIPGWQKFLAVLLMAFSMTLFGCKTEIRPSDKISEVPVQTIPILRVESQLPTAQPENEKPSTLVKSKKKKSNQFEDIETITMIMGFTVESTSGFTVDNSYLTLLPEKLRPANNVHNTSSKLNY